MELTLLQKKIINAPEPKIAVNACAAALKTTTLIEKARKLLQSGIEPNKIAIITFTKMAASELVERLGDDYKDGMFVGTIHALAALFMSKNGDGQFINKYAEEDNFDKFFNKCKAYDLKGSFEWVLFDEAMDSSRRELEFVFDMLEPSHYFVCYDLRQSIYRWKGAEPRLLVKYLKETGATFYSLNENYRNGSEILNYAKWIIARIGMEDDSICATHKKGRKEKVAFTYDSLINSFKERKDYGHWAILTRDNRTLENIARGFQKNGIPFNTFKQSELKHQDLREKLKENKLTLLTVHSAKGLAWDNVITFGLRWPKEYARDFEEETCINYVAATRAKEALIVGNIRK